MSRVLGEAPTFGCWRFDPSPGSPAYWAIKEGWQMKNEEFKKLWEILDSLYSSRMAGGGGLDNLSHGGKISFAKKIKAELDDWCDELVARAKAEFESEQRNYDTLK